MKWNGYKQERKKSTILIYIWYDVISKKLYWLLQKTLDADSFSMVATTQNQEKKNNGFVTYQLQTPWETINVIPFTIASKTYLGMSLSKKVKVIYNENVKIWKRSISSSQCYPCVSLLRFSFIPNFSGVMICRLVILCFMSDFHLCVSTYHAHLSDSGLPHSE